MASVTRSPFHSVAAAASIAAGAIHAAAVGAHAEHQQAAITFALLAVLQLGWGVAAMLPSERESVLNAVPRWPRLVACGVAINGGAVLGWVLAKTTGIGFIDGLERAEALQFADSSAAFLALAAVGAAMHELIARPAQVDSRTAEPQPAQRPSLASDLLPVMLIPIVILTLASMLSIGSHDHPDGAAGSHHHPNAAAEDGADHDPADHAGHTAASEPKAFKADKPVDLSGVPGVTPEQQAQAEDLLGRTLEKLPQFADITTLSSRGFYSIGDAATGAEHFVNWSNVNDDVILDPDKPEALVVRSDFDGPKLVAAMFMLPEGSTIDDVPDLGGPLLQWHVHNDLCLTNDPVAPTLAPERPLAGTDGQCIPPNSKRGNVPMIHVWIVDNPCGPFAALEGVAGGQVINNEPVLCTEEHAHVGGP